VGEDGLNLFLKINAGNNKQKDMEPQEREGEHCIIGIQKRFYRTKQLERVA